MLSVILSSCREEIDQLKKRFGNDEKLISEALPV